MKKQIPLLMLAAFLCNTTVNGAPVVDGTLDTSIYGSAIAIQTVGTQFGDNASELDAAYATVVSNKLYLMLTGNLENNFNRLEIFIDSTDAVTTNVLNMAGNDGTDALDGLVFDDGFSPDYNFHIRHGGTDFYIDFSDLASQSSVQYGPFFGGSSEGSAQTSTSAINASPIGVGFNNSNTAGIGSGTNAADQAAATNVLTGLELCIDLADIGNPAQTIKIGALINSSANDYLSNQMLGGLPAGTENLGSPGAVDLNDYASDQFFTVNVPAELTCELSASLGGNMVVGKTNTVSLNIRNLSGIASNITSTLTFNPAGELSVISSNTPAGPLGSGDSLIHTYDVVADTNGTYVLTAEVSANGTVFTTNTFELNVLLQAVPHVLETELTIRVAPGQIGSGSVTLTTDGDEAAPFTVTADAQLPVLYTVETQSVSRLSFWSADVQPDTVFNSWTETDSAPMDIGFGFTLFGTEYTSFSVSQYGFLTLSNTVGATAQLAPFQTTATVNQSTIRYDRVGNEQLVIAWGNDTGREFQLRLHADGTFDYLYEIGAWGAGTIGLSADSISQTINHSPGQTGNDALHLAPETWVSFSPAEGTLPAVSTRLLTFTADATAIPSPATYTFTATVDWGGTSDEIDVTVIVDAPYVQLDVPATVAFSGLAGYISPPAILTVTNSGNVPLTYSITDTGLRDAGYASESVDYQWRHIPETIDTVLSESVLDTEPVAIGFPFVFFGRTRTNLTVETDGTLIFDDGASITPYSAGLFLDGNAQIRMLTDASLDHFTVTWEKLVQPGGGEDQTFQAVLNRDDGTIRFNYMQLTGNWRDGVIRLTDGTTVAGTLINDDTIERIEEIPVIETTYVTNQIGNYVQIFKVETVVGTNTVITYTENANRQSLEFAPGQSRIITFSPIFGTIVVGATADITLVGNASSLTEGGGNTVTNDTLLTFCAESVQPLEQTLVSASDQYEWIRSVSNSDEWYLARLGGVAPRIPRPTNVYINGAYRAEKTPGELAWQTWGWGNNDPGVIDFDTIYIRSDNVDWDPDDRPADYIRKKPHSVTESTAVTFTATNSLETAYPAPAVVKAMWGTDEPVVKSQQNSDGSHTLSWPAAQDDLSRTYNVLYTTSLSDPWTLLDTVKNATSYVDDQHNNEPVIFYKVTVQ